MEQTPLSSEKQTPPSVSRMSAILQAIRSCADTTLKIIGAHVHPNQITIARLPATAAAIAIDQISHVAGASTYAVSMLFDWVDGAVARRCEGLSTREGTVLDPLVDKASNFTALSYHVIAHIDDVALATVASLSVLLNVLSQLQRGNPVQQINDAVRGVVSPETCEVVTSEKKVEGIKANYFGKAKQWIECGSIGSLFLAGNNDEARLIGVIGLGISSLLSLVSTLKRYLQS